MSTSQNGSYGPRPHITEPTRGTFKGNPTLSLPLSNPQYPLTFGVEKAHAIVRHFEAIKAFATDNPWQPQS